MRPLRNLGGDPALVEAACTLYVPAP
jgi:hypothetical protein